VLRAFKSVRVWRVEIRIFWVSAWKNFHSCAIKFS
jgi:hypothetical protein